MKTEQYAIYADDGTLLGSVEVIGEDEQDCQAQFDAYLAELENSAEEEDQ